VDNFYRLVEAADLPFNRFHRIPLNRTPAGMTSVIYLVNKPFVGVPVDLSQKPIKLGDYGGIHFISVAGSYKLGFLIEALMPSTLLNSRYMFVGRREHNRKALKCVDIMYSDEFINILQCRQTASYLILPTCNLDFPKPMSLSELNEGE